jgi:NAD(P)-dependent dehydrogenase (short-subunit alcohol dehydrogenase family)
VTPGFVNTDMVHKLCTPNVLNQMLDDFSRVTLRRLVEPEEIAAAVAFDDARYTVAVMDGCSCAREHRRDRRVAVTDVRNRP